MPVLKNQVEGVAGFKSPLIGHYINSRDYLLTDGFQYYTNVGAPEGEVNYIHVPTLTITNFASIPRVVWIWVPPNGQYGKAAVVHDYLYVNHYFTRKEADKIFLEAMEVLGVSKFKRKTMYRAVRMFGWISYKKGHDPVD